MRAAIITPYAPFEIRLTTGGVYAREQRWGWRDIDTVRIDEGGIVIYKTVGEHDHVSGKTVDMPGAVATELIAQYRRSIRR